MVLFQVCLIGQDPLIHGTVAFSGDGQGVVDIVIDNGGCAVSLECAVGQVIVPGDHGHLTILLEEVEVMDDATHITVAVDHIVMHHEVAQHFIHIDGGQIALTQRLQRLDHTGLIRFRQVGFDTAKQAGIRGGVIAHILQHRVTHTGNGATHGAHVNNLIFAIVLSAFGTAAAALICGSGCAGFGGSGFAAFGAFTAALGRHGFTGLGFRGNSCFGALGAFTAALGRHGFTGLRFRGNGCFGALGALAAAFDRHGFTGLGFRGNSCFGTLGAFTAALGRHGFTGLGFRGNGCFAALGALAATANIFNRVGSSSVFLTAAGAGILIGSLVPFLTAVTRTAGAAIRLVQVAVGHTVISQDEAVFNGFYRQIQTPILTVDSNVHKAAQRSIGTEFIHHGVGQVVLHHGVVLDHIVQTQLVQAVIALGIIILIKLDLKAVPLGTHGGNRGQRGVSLAPNAHIAEGFAIDHHIAHGIDLALGSAQKRVPIVNHDVNGVDTAVIKQPVLISDSPCHDLYAQSFTVHKQDTQQHGKNDRSGTDPIDPFMGTHPMYSPL